MACGQIPATPAPPPVGLRPKSAAPRPRISGQADSIPPAAAPRAQCLCRRVSGTVPGARLGGHVRLCVARSAHGEAENCAASPRTRARRANARNGRCFPPCVPGEQSSFICWERPQPELSPQLVYPWGAAVTCGSWQGAPGGYRLKFRPAGPGPRSGLKPGSRGGAPATAVRRPRFGGQPPKAALRPEIGRRA